MTHFLTVEPSTLTMRTATGLPSFSTSSAWTSLRCLARPKERIASPKTRPALPAGHNGEGVCVQTPKGRDGVPGGRASRTSGVGWRMERVAVPAVLRRALAPAKFERLRSSWRNDIGTAECRQPPRLHNTRINAAPTQGSQRGGVTYPTGYPQLYPPPLLPGVN